MNRTRILALLVVLALCLALAGSTAFAGSSSPPGAAYQLSRSTWRAQGMSAGSGYRLAPAGTSLSSGTPCCCALAPCQFWR